MIKWNMRWSGLSSISRLMHKSQKQKQRTLSLEVRQFSVLTNFLHKSWKFGEKLAVMKSIKMFLKLVIACS